MIVVRSGHILRVVMNILEIICEGKIMLMSCNALKAEIVVLYKNCKSMSRGPGFGLQTSFPDVLMSFLYV